MLERAHACEAHTPLKQRQTAVGVVSQVVVLTQALPTHLFIYLPLVLISYFPDHTKYIRQAAQQDPGIHLSNWDCKTLGFVYMNSGERT